MNPNTTIPVDTSDFGPFPSNVKLAYSPDEIAAEFGTSRTTIYNEINAGRLESFRIGIRRYVSFEAAVRYIRARGRETKLPKDCTNNVKRLGQTRGWLSDA